MDERVRWTGLPDKRWVVIAALLGIVALVLLGSQLAYIFGGKYVH